MDNDRLRNTSDHPRLLPGHITAAFNSKAFEDIFAGKDVQRGQPAQCRIRGRASTSMCPIRDIYKQVVCIAFF